MDRPRHNAEQIVRLLREAQLRLEQGDSLVAVCKSLGISPSNYRRWRNRYGERTKEKEAAVVSETSEQIAGARSTEDLLGRAAKESQSGDIPKLSDEAKELLDDANGTSGSANHAWLAFLALLAYLLVALGGVSHKDLLLNSPVKLPIVDVEIPLFSFFQYAPVLLLLVYLSLLIQHVILARKYRKFAEAIAPYEKETQAEHPARELVDSYVVSQILAGPRRHPAIRWLMRLMVFVTFALLPIVTLFYFQVTFLPYHAVWITYWHRIAVLLGLAMLFVALPIIHLRPRKREVKLGPQTEAWRASPYGIAIGAVYAALILGFSWLVATVPDEDLDRAVGFVTPIELKDVRGPNPLALDPSVLLNPIVRKFLHFAYHDIHQADNREDEGRGGEGEAASTGKYETSNGEEDEGRGGEGEAASTGKYETSNGEDRGSSRDSVLRWLVSYRVLVVEDTDLVPDEGDDQDEVSVVLRGRDLRFARLTRSDLHRADLTEADLRGAQMWGARLEKAKLEKAKLQRAMLDDAELQGADLTEANLQRAEFRSASLQGARLVDARLEGAILWPTELQGALLRGARLSGAYLSGANLQGANLSGAKLQGANLGGAKLQGADLTFAGLEGADLSGAQLQRAYMGNARLSGANLGGAELQGADLRGAKLQGADLTDVEIWLASFPGNLAEQTPAPLGVASLKMSPPEADAKAKLKKRLQTITDAKLLERLMERLEPILRNVPPNWEDEDSWREYIRQANEPPPEELAQLLGRMACGDSKGDVSQEIARRAIAKELARKVLNRRSKQTPSYVKPLAQALLSTNCEGAKALADESRAKLRVLGGIDNLIRHGNVLVDRGDYDGAIADYDKVLAATPDDAIALNGRAWAYAQKGELDKALAGAERAVRLNPEDANTVHTRAWIYLNKGSLDLALTDFDKALSLDAELARAYADRGRTYELKGERDKAIADYYKALSLKSRRTYDDKAKAEASRHLIALGENVGSDGEEVAPPSAPQAPGKF